MLKSLLVTAVLGAFAFGGADARAATWSRPVALGADTQDALRGAIGSDGTSVVTWSSAGVVRVSVGDRRGRFGPVTRVSRTAGELSVAAVAPDGRVLVAWMDTRTRGLRVAVRRPHGRFGPSRLITRKVGDPQSPQLALAADRGGKFVLAFKRQRADGGGEIRATTLDRRGRPGAIDVLGDGNFTILFDQEQAIAVDSRGVATLALVTDRGPAIAQRPPNGRFAAPTPIAPGAPAADALRIASGPTGVVASWTSNPTVREPLNVGAPTATLATPGGTFGSPLTGDASAPEATFVPSSAPLGDDRAVLVWHRLDRSGQHAALWLAPVTAGTVGPARPIAAAAASGIVKPLANGRALILWSAHSGALKVRLVDTRGTLETVASPQGREQFADDAMYGTRVLYTAANAALVAWNDVNGHLRASVGRL